eukprot:PhM_4_TR8388/c0_g1_i1/m.12013
MNTAPPSSLTAGTKRRSYETVGSAFNQSLCLSVGDAPSLALSTPTTTLLNDGEDGNDRVKDEGSTTAVSQSLITREREVAELHRTVERKTRTIDLLRTTLHKEVLFLRHELDGLQGSGMCPHEAAQSTFFDIFEFLDALDYRRDEALVAVKQQFDASLREKEHEKNRAVAEMRAHYEAKLAMALEQVEFFENLMKTRVEVAMAQAETSYKTLRGDAHATETALVNALRESRRLGEQLQDKATRLQALSDRNEILERQLKREKDHRDMAVAVAAAKAKEESERNHAKLTSRILLSRANTAIKFDSAALRKQSSAGGDTDRGDVHQSNGEENTEKPAFTTRVINRFSDEYLELEQKCSNLSRKALDAGVEIRDLKDEVARLRKQLRETTLEKDLAVSAASETRAISDPPLSPGNASLSSSSNLRRRTSILQSSSGSMRRPTMSKLSTQGRKTSLVSKADGDAPSSISPRRKLSAGKRVETTIRKPARRPTNRSDEVHPQTEFDDFGPVLLSPRNNQKHEAPSPVPITVEASLSCTYGSDLEEERSLRKIKETEKRQKADYDDMVRQRDDALERVMMLEAERDAISGVQPFRGTANASTQCSEPSPSSWPDRADTPVRMSRAGSMHQPRPPSSPILERQMMVDAIDPFLARRPSSVGEMGARPPRVRSTATGAYLCEAATQWTEDDEAGSSLLLGGASLSVPRSSSVDSGSPRRPHSSSEVDSEPPLDDVELVRTSFHGPARFVVMFKRAVSLTALSAAHGELPENAVIHNLVKKHKGTVLAISSPAPTHWAVLFPSPTPGCSFIFELMDAPQLSVTGITAHDGEAHNCFSTVLARCADLLDGALGKVLVCSSEALVPFTLRKETVTTLACCTRPVFVRTLSIKIRVTAPPPQWWVPTFDCWVSWWSWRVRYCLLVLVAGDTATHLLSIPFSNPTALVVYRDASESFTIHPSLQHAVSFLQYLSGQVSHCVSAVLCETHDAVHWSACKHSELTVWNEAILSMRHDVTKMGNYGVFFPAHLVSSMRRSFLSWVMNTCDVPGMYWMQPPALDAPRATFVRAFPHTTWSVEDSLPFLFAQNNNKNSTRAEDEQTLFNGETLYLACVEASPGATEYMKGVLAVCTMGIRVALSGSRLYSPHAHITAFTHPSRALSYALNVVDTLQRVSWPETELQDAEDDNEFKRPRVRVAIVKTQLGPHSLRFHLDSRMYWLCDDVVARALGVLDALPFDTVGATQDVSVDLDPFLEEGVDLATNVFSSVTLKDLLPKPRALGKVTAMPRRKLLLSYQASQMERVRHEDSTISLERAPFVSHLPVPPLYSVTYVVVDVSQIASDLSSSRRVGGGGMNTQQQQHKAVFQLIQTVAVKGGVIMSADASKVCAAFSLVAIAIDFLESLFDFTGSRAGAHTVHHPALSGKCDDSLKTFRLSYVGALTTVAHAMCMRAVHGQYCLSEAVYKTAYGGADVNSSSLNLPTIEVGDTLTCHYAAYDAKGLVTAGVGHTHVDLHALWDFMSEQLAPAWCPPLRLGSGVVRYSATVPLERVMGFLSDQFTGGGTVEKVERGAANNTVKVVFLLPESDDVRSPAAVSASNSSEMIVSCDAAFLRVNGSCEHGFKYDLGGQMPQASAPSGACYAVGVSLHEWVSVPSHLTSAVFDLFELVVRSIVDEWEGRAVVMNRVVGGAVVILSTLRAALRVCTLIQKALLDAAWPSELLECEGFGAFHVGDDTTGQFTNQRIEGMSYPLLHRGPRVSLVLALEHLFFDRRDGAWGFTSKTLRTLAMARAVRPGVLGIEAKLWRNIEANFSSAFLDQNCGVLRVVFSETVPPGRVEMVCVSLKSRPVRDMSLLEATTSLPADETFVRGAKPGTLLHLSEAGYTPTTIGTAPSTRYYCVMVRCDDAVIADSVRYLSSVVGGFEVECGDRLRSTAVVCLLENEEEVAALVNVVRGMPGGMGVPLPIGISHGTVHSEWNGQMDRPSFFGYTLACALWMGQGCPAHTLLALDPPERLKHRLHLNVMTEVTGVYHVTERVFVVGTVPKDLGVATFPWVRLVPSDVEVAEEYVVLAALLPGEVAKNFSQVGRFCTRYGFYCSQLAHNVAILVAHIDIIADGSVMERIVGDVIDMLKAERYAISDGTAQPTTRSDGYIFFLGEAVQNALRMLTYCEVTQGAISVASCPSLPNSKLITTGPIMPKPRLNPNVDTRDPDSTFSGCVTRVTMHFFGTITTVATNRTLLLPPHIVVPSQHVYLPSGASAVVVGFSLDTVLPHVLWGLLALSTVGTCSGAMSYDPLTTQFDPYHFLFEPTEVERAFFFATRGVMCAAAFGVSFNVAIAQGGVFLTLDRARHTVLVLGPAVRTVRRLFAEHIVSNKILVHVESFPETLLDLWKRHSGGASGDVAMSSAPHRPEDEDTYVAECSAADEREYIPKSDVRATVFVTVQGMDLLHEGALRDSSSRALRELILLSASFGGGLRRMATWDFTIYFRHMQDAMNFTAAVQANFFHTPWSPDTLLALQGTLYGKQNVVDRVTWCDCGTPVIGLAEDGGTTSEDSTSGPIPLCDITEARDKQNSATTTSRKALASTAPTTSKADITAAAPPMISPSSIPVLAEGLGTGEPASHHDQGFVTPERPTIDVGAGDTIETVIVATPPQPAVGPGATGATSPRTVRNLRAFLESRPQRQPTGLASTMPSGVLGDLTQQNRVDVDDNDDAVAKHRPGLPSIRRPNVSKSKEVDSTGEDDLVRVSDALDSLNRVIIDVVEGTTTELQMKDALRKIQRQLRDGVSTKQTAVLLPRIGDALNRVATVVQAQKVVSQQRVAKAVAMENDRMLKKFRLGRRFDSVPDNHPHMAMPNTESNEKGDGDDEDDNFALDVPELMQLRELREGIDRLVKRVNRINAHEVKVERDEPHPQENHHTPRTSSPPRGRPRTAAANDVFHLSADLQLARPPPTRPCSGRVKPPPRLRRDMQMDFAEYAMSLKQKLHE